MSNAELRITNHKTNFHMYGYRSLLNASNMNEMNAQQPNFLTPLLAAVAGQHETVVRMLIEGGSSTNAADTDGVTALHIAAQRGFTSIVRLLVDAGANVYLAQPPTPGQIFHPMNIMQYIQKVTDHFRRLTCWTPLMAAAYGGHVDIVKILIKCGADVNVTFDDGSTALHIAAEYGHRKIVRTLLKSGSEVDSRNHSEMTPLAVAAKKGNLNIVHTLLKKSARVGKKGDLQAKIHHCGTLLMKNTLIFSNYLLNITAKELSMNLTAMV